MSKAALWFPREEFLSRLARIQTALRAKQLDGLIAFLPETVTWATGYFTRAYGTLQFAIIPAHGEPTMFARDVEAYYLDATCVFADRVLWADSDDRMKLAGEAIVRRFGRSAKLGIELQAWPLSAGRYTYLCAALPGYAWQDETELAARMRLIKSPAELAYQRRAATAAEAGMQAAIKTAAAGVSEREIAAEICAAMIRAGSDLPGPGVLSSGERAFHLHGGYSDRVLAPGDLVQIETTPNVRHYHARFMRPIRIGPVTDEDVRTVESLIAIQDEAICAVAPGVPATVPDAIYRDGVLRAGLRESYTNKTFYSVGLILQPNGGEPLEATPASDWSFEVGQTFHTYVLARGFGMSETITITPDGCERLTRFPRQLFTK
jgi:Xaa-Pro dipeptidase